MTADIDPTEALLAEQVRYYRARAAEFDQTIFHPGGRAEERPKSPADDERVVRELRLSGDVLELACGTGNWTRHLAQVADTVLAVDVAAEMIGIARPKVHTSNVSFVQADVFTWSPRRRFDAIFFGFWLSHVPPSMFQRFWERLAALLADDGRVIAIDELPERRHLEGHLTSEDGLPVARRQLQDGSRHRVVKVFYAADELQAALSDLGWTADVKALERGIFQLEARRR